MFLSSFPLDFGFRTWDLDLGHRSWTLAFAYEIMNVTVLHCDAGGQPLGPLMYLSWKGAPHLGKLQFVRAKQIFRPLDFTRVQNLQNFGKDLQK